MKQIRLQGEGAAHEVVRCVDADPPAPLQPDEVRVQVLAFPINQADLLTLQGRYAGAATEPATLGLEAVGRVISVGAQVDRLRVGELAILLGQRNWSELRQVHWSQAMPVPSSVDPLQLAMLKVNPATAAMLLTRFVALDHGDWIVFNAANSGVGRSLIQLARLLGVRTAALARRAELLPALRTHGADLALLDDEEAPAAVRAAVGDARLPLAADAVGGSATARLLACLDDRGSLVCYGGLQGQPCAIDVRDLVFRDIRVHGFWLTRTLAESDYEQLVPLYRELGDCMRAGRLQLPVAHRYPMHAIADAIAVAALPGDGKVLVTTPAYAEWTDTVAPRASQRAAVPVERVEIAP
ncbi:2-enoyl thioester reductase domain-containing protein [Lysobacter sp. 5GHs7-4]|uniref:MDR family NADPH-dependent oxidoreductase n=1 Tax=Lysobacter sp. 5GHs7-4 TaxID=2904253 RepID=UPI001E5EE872|nr:2-enoyl thioester reductase domain-containing protein [Lysobacter sp. 5GHs7-4]UHQ21857.1 2-enoyl thioester reductase domain-containing protein [Lysobacter sp. 5GHs7-4]